MNKYLAAGLLVLVVAGWFFWPQPTVAPAESSQVTATQPRAVVRSAIVPHHDLVAAQRRTVLTDWAAQVGSVSALVVVSPDHFGAAKTHPLTTDRTWATSVGEIKPDQAVIDAWLATGQVDRLDSAFNREHGIFNLLGDIRSLWPDVPIIPLILPAGSDLDALTTELKALCADCGLIASVDMSHYQPAALASLHDVFTQRALALGDDGLLVQAEVDCPQCLVLARRFAGDSVHFVERMHTNSGLLAGNFDAETTTHLMGWFEAGANEAAAKRTFQFGGDVMLGRDIAQKYQADGFSTLWSGLGERAFWGVDVSFVNFEAPLSTDRAVPALQANNLRFIAPAVSSQLLVQNHVAFAGLANNHTLTWGGAVFKQTQAGLQAAGLTTVGRPDEVVVTKLAASPGRLATALIAVNLIDGPMSGIPEAIEAAKADGFSVVMIPHWGVEYQTTHNQEQERLARDWIAAGADLIIGGHPHVVQDAQVIDGVPVVYSLGNLVFDQYFSTETQRGLIVGVVMTEESIELTLAPLKDEKGRPSLLRGDERRQRLEPFCAALSVAASKADCSMGVFLINRASK